MKIEIQKKIYKTSSHPQIATTMALIAQQWSRIGNYERALEQFESVLGGNRAFQNNFQF
jgi:hypothetical protein